jgi:hypothetical protein
MSFKAIYWFLILTLNAFPKYINGYILLRFVEVGNHGIESCQLQAPILGLIHRNQIYIYVSKNMLAININ